MLEADLVIGARFREALVILRFGLGHLRRSLRGRLLRVHLRFPAARGGWVDTCEDVDF